MSSAMGNEVSAGEAEQEETEEEEEGWTSREDTEASGGLWSLSHELDDGREVCVFTCSATSASQRQLCQAGANHLRLLRHPHILKFLSYDITMDPVMLVTEPVLPVKGVMSGMCAEGMVTGWRGVAQGLLFLHDKAKLSHNSLCCECVYMCVNTSQWKVGGFEAAAPHSKISNTFIDLIAAIRPPTTIPPEDKAPTPESTPAVPCHSRDVWAFSHLILSALEEADLSSQISDSMYTYIQQHMLNPDPTLRPTVGEILTQSWMRNDASEITEFLSHLTVKSQAEKDKFFASLSPRLHTLPPSVVAEHLVPLLLTPLVMTERVARRSLWPHLLTPVSAAHPRRMTFDPSRICPLLDEELFVCHAIPLLLNLMENHDYHVRMVLLEHLLHFAPLCPEEELVSSLLPEVLVGLHDCHDEMVKATLRALADLVDLVGGETIMGTERSNIFIDATPRSQDFAADEDAMVLPHAPPAPLPSLPSLPSSSSTQEEVRRQRAEKMRQQREKREMQRQKKLAASSKLGVARDTVDVEGVESEELTTPLNHAQYSPSVSHDEEDRINKENAGRQEEGEEGEGLDEEWEEFTEDRGTGEDLGWGEGWGEGEGSLGGVEDQLSGREEGAVEGEMESGWSLQEEGGGGWKLGGERRDKGEGEGRGVGWRLGGERREKGEDGGDSGERREKREEGGGSGERREKGERGMKSSTSKPLRLGSGRGKRQERGEDRGTSKADNGQRKTEGEGRGWAQSTLSESDCRRLEEQAAWSTEPNFFADMAPVVTKTSKLGVSNRRITSTGKTKPLLQYQPPDTEEGGGWGGWNDF